MEVSQRDWHPLISLALHLGEAATPVPTAVPSRMASYSLHRSDPEGSGLDSYDNYKYKSMVSMSLMSAMMMVYDG